MKKLIVFGALLVLIACGGPEYKGNATITAHQYDDPDDEYVPGYQMPEQCYGGYGSQPRTCYPGIYIPGHTNHRPERFILRVEWTDDKGKQHHDGYEVPRTAYDGCPDGRTINLGSMQCPPR